MGGKKTVQSCIRWPREPRRRYGAFRSNLSCAGFMETEHLFEHGHVQGGGGRRFVSKVCSNFVSTCS